MDAKLILVRLPNTPAPGPLRCTFNSKIPGGLPKYPAWTEKLAAYCLGERDGSGINSSLNDIEWERKQ